MLVLLGGQVQVYSCDPLAILTLLLTLTLRLPVEQQERGPVLCQCEISILHRPQNDMTSPLEAKRKIVGKLELTVHKRVCHMTACCSVVESQMLKT